MIPRLVPNPETCAHRWRRHGGCRVCVLPHDVAPYIEPGNHLALEPGYTYVCRCGRTLHIGDVPPGKPSTKEE